MALERLRQNDEVSRGAGALRWEGNHTLVFEEHSRGVLLTLDDLVERRVSELFKRDFGLLDLRHDLPVFGLGSPAAHGEDRARLAELREDKIAVPVEALQLLAQPAPQRERLDLDFENENVITCLHQLREIGHSPDVLLQQSLRCRTNALIRTTLIVARAFSRRDGDNGIMVLQTLLNFFADKLRVAQTLIVHTVIKELVEVKVVFHEEANITCLELHRLVSKNLRVWPHVDIEGPAGVSRAACVPLEARDANLERIHPATVVLQLLVPVFGLIKAVSFVLEANSESTELGIDSDKVRGQHRLDHEVEPIGEVIH